MLFRQLNAAEELKFRRWAREHYRPGDPINGAWHPSTQSEAVAMNHERAMFVVDRPEVKS